MSGEEHRLPIKVRSMPTRGLGSLLFACLLLVNGWNACAADTAEKANEATAATRAASSVEAKRASFAARAKQSFTKVVGQNFANWDQNGDGRISADEIDRLIADPSVNGLQAAAVASIHRYLRADGAPPALTQADLLAKVQEQPLLPEQGDNREVRHDQNDGKPRFVVYYTRFAQHLKLAPRDLFTGDEGPTLEGIKQGALGDCFFMCVIGATVNRDPQTIRKMLRANPDGTTDVKFPSVKKVRVPRLTDGEIALTSSAADQGLWINVLEKAFGEVRYAQPKSHHSEDEIDLDVISRGGKILSTIELMTGHKAFVIPIRKYKNKKYHLPSGAELPRTIARLDSAFSKAFAANRLVCAEIAPGVSGKDIPPGLVGKHAYAVLGYVQASRTVTVWNPHGKDYTPKVSPAGLENGYPVKKGVFQMPLDEFVRVFKSVTYETSAALPAT
jgi:Calpain family cysteine protease